MAGSVLLASVFLFVVLSGCGKHTKEDSISLRTGGQGTESTPLQPAVSEVDRLIEEFRDSDTSEERCENAAKELSEIGDAAIGPLTGALRDGNWLVRYYAARALGWMKWKDARISPPLAEDTRVVEALIQALEDRNPRVRGSVCWAFAKIKDERATEPLIEVLKKDADSNVRSTAAWGLG
jgi:HEAT repeat protein